MSHPTDDRACSEEEPIVSWSESREQLNDHLRYAVLRDIGFFVRVTVAIAIVFGIFYWLHPGGFYSVPVPFRLYLPLFIFGFIALEAIVWLFRLLAERRSMPRRYSIRESGIDRDHPSTHWAWDRIRGYEITPDQITAGGRIVTLHLGQNQIVNIPLPDDENAELVVETLRKRAICFPHSPANHAVSKRMWLSVGIGSTIVGAVLAQMIWSDRTDVTRAAIKLAGLIVLFGPGTWVALARRKVYEFDERLRLAVACNLLCAVTLLTVSACWIMQSLPPGVFPPKSWPPSTRQAG